MSRTAQRTKHEPVAVAVAVVLQELAALGLRGAADGEQQGCEAEGLDRGLLGLLWWLMQGAAAVLEADPQT